MCLPSNDSVTGGGRTKIAAACLYPAGERIEQLCGSLSRGQVEPSGGGGSVKGYGDPKHRRPEVTAVKFRASSSAGKPKPFDRAIPDRPTIDTRIRYTRSIQQGCPEARNARQSENLPAITTVNRPTTYQLLITMSHRDPERRPGFANALYRSVSS